MSAGDAMGRRSRRIKGIVPPMATPLTGRDALDVAGLERLVEHILAGGVHGIFLLGTTGEGPALSYRLRRELMERVCRQVDGRVPVLVAVSDTAYEETLRVAEWAAAAGAASIVLAPPYYLPVSQADLLRLIESLADSALPLFLYNMPALTKVSFDLETVERASEMPHVAGLKDSSGNMGYLREVLECVRGNASFSVLVGPEHLLAEALVAGADGGVPGGANLFPGLLVKLYAAFERREFVAMHELQEQIVRLGAQIWKSDDEAGAGALRRLKCALNLAGLCSSTPAWPYVESDLAEREQMEEHLRRHGILP